MKYTRVADTGDIPAGTMKHIEAGEKEICIANVGGKFHAFGDRCPHMNARLSMGTLQGTTVTCPFHFSRFDVTTGQKLYGPVMMTMEGSHTHPPEFVEAMKRMAELMAPIKTYDLELFRVRVDGQKILVEI